LTRTQLLLSQEVLHRRGGFRPEAAHVVVRAKRGRFPKLLPAPFLLSVSAIDNSNQGGKKVHIEIPEEIQAPAEENFSSSVSAIGVQIYVCTPKEGAPGQFEWSLKAPEADLFDSDGKLIGRHYKDEASEGPAWELSDGSKVVANAARAKKHNVENSIPWLWLPAKKNDGYGALSQVKSVQRLATLGGKPPAAPADERQSGKELRVYYSATYYFNS
jgi:hypothetical protein